LYVSDSSTGVHSLVGIGRDKTIATHGSSGVWSVGAYPDGTLPFDGRIDDVHVADFAASEAYSRAMAARGARDFDVDEVEGNDFYTSYVRVLIGDEDSGFLEGEWHDFTNILDVDWLQTVRWSNDSDKQSQTGTVTLARNVYFASIAPLLDTNAAPTVRVMRRAMIETCIVPRGMPLSRARLYMEPRFDGFIRKLDVGPELATLELSDRLAGLQVIQIEPDPDSGQDQKYGSNIGAAVEGQLQNIVDENDPGEFRILSIDDDGPSNAIVVQTFDETTGLGRPHGLKVGDVVHIQSTSNFNGTDDVIAAVTTETFTLTRTTAGAFAEETGGLVYAAGRHYPGGKPTIYVPTSPGWNVYEWYIPPTKNVAQAIDDVTTQFGWVCHFRYDDNRKEFRLTLRAPDRTGSAVSQESGRSFFTKITQLTQDIDSIRSPIIVEYQRRSTTDNVGRYLRRAAAAANADSIAKYGRNVGRVGIETAHLLQSLSEAQTLADNMNSDLAEPLASLEGERPYHEVYDTDDLITFTPNDIHFSADTDFAVVYVEHTFSANSHRTTMRLRNAKPVARVERAVEMLQQSGYNPGRGLAPLPTPAAPVAAAIAGGAALSWTFPQNNLQREYDTTEIHLSTSTGFSPSAATLIGVTRGSAFPVMNLSGGTTYYVKLVHRDAMGNVASASPQTSVTPTSGGVGGGDVSGPGSSTDRAIATWNGAAGDTLRDNANAKVLSSGAVLVKASAGGLILFDGTNYWRLTMTTRGAITTTNLGTSEPTT
jgi:hypothetical protein